MRQTAHDVEECPPASHRGVVPRVDRAKVRQGGEDESVTETLRDVLRKTRNLTDRLERFDIFSEVEAGLDGSTSALADNEDVDLVVKIKEASKYYIRTATDVGDGEGSAV